MTPMTPIPQASSGTWRPHLLLSILRGKSPVTWADTPQEAPVDFRRIGWIIVAGLVIYWAITDPSGAGAALHKLEGIAKQGANAIGTLMGSL